MVTEIKSLEQMLEVFGKPDPRPEVSRAIIASALATAETVEDVEKIGELTGFQKNEIATVNAKSKGKTMLSPGITVTERDWSPYNPDGSPNDAPDGLTPEEKGPCT